MRSAAALRQACLVYLKWRTQPSLLSDIRRRQLGAFDCWCKVRIAKDHGHRAQWLSTRAAVTCHSDRQIGNVPACGDSPLKVPIPTCSVLIPARVAAPISVLNRAIVAKLAPHSEQNFSSCPGRSNKSVTRPHSPHCFADSAPRICHLTLQLLSWLCRLRHRNEPATCELGASIERQRGPEALIAAFRRSR